MPAGRTSHFDDPDNLRFCRNDHTAAIAAGRFIEITGALGYIPVATGTRPTRSGLARRVAVSLRTIAVGATGPIRHRGDVWLQIKLPPWQTIAAGQNYTGRVGVEARTGYAVPDILGIGWVRKLYNPSGVAVASYRNTGVGDEILDALVTLDHKRASSIMFKDSVTGTRGMMECLHCGAGISATKIWDGVYQIDRDLAASGSG